MIITGYPRVTSDAELDRMIEAECEKGWEEQQAEVAQMRTLTEEEMVNAFASCAVAISCFDHLLDWIATTIDRSKGTPEADKLAGMYDELSDRRLELKKIKEGWDK